MEATTRVQFGEEILIVGSGASLDGNTLIIGEGGTFELVGDLTGQVIVDAPARLVTLVLNGVSIHNPTGPAILGLAANGLTIELAAGSVNYLSDGGTSDYDAALYSESPLTITGEGELDVRAVYEGISSTTHMTFLGGFTRVVAEEDGINANRDGVSRISVHGGVLYSHGITGDGIDSNGTIHITGGKVIAISELGSMDSGLDADVGIYIEGGFVAATGVSAHLPLITPGEQSTVVVDFVNIQDADGLVVLADQDGRALLAFASPVTYTRLVLSSPDIVAGGRYVVHRGGGAVGAGINGLYVDAVELGSPVAEVSGGRSVTVLPVTR
ncbi:MAG: carbohydrate-binding domain-containing protein [Trueperaceae bacterium]|nr:carbohydrate-binding domain-containing protein [Trueperaceae bacterium]